MKITIIRHGKVNIEWPKKCNSTIFDKACKEYDLADIESVDGFHIDIDCKNIYVSNFPRSFKIAQALFPRKNYIEMDNIGEVPLRSFLDLNVQLPLWIWNVIGRLQWYLNSSRQNESRHDTTKRADKVIYELEKKNVDCVLVTHGFFMNTLINRLKKQGYSVNGQKLLKFSNLQMVTAEKKE